MADWLSSMQQTFEYYIVDPNTWMDSKKIDNVKSCTINRDSEAETLGSATIDIAESVGECYIRAYLVTIQNGITEKHPLGTFLVQTPSSSFDGKSMSISMDAYTPLLELKENIPPLGYYIPKNTRVMDTAYRLVSENARAPVVKPDSDTTLYYDFIADPSDTWLSYLTDLVVDAKYTFDLDELGRILFAPKQDTASLRPVWTYNDDNSSILLPELSLDHDLYNIPNVVEVIYSNGAESFYAKAVNDDPNSPISTVNRGRPIVRRITDPDLISDPIKEAFYYKVVKKAEKVFERTDEEITISPDEHKERVPFADAVTTMGDRIYYEFDTNTLQDEYYCVVYESRQINEYAKQVLKELSTLEYSVSYTHGYCPVRVGDCVMLNYTRAGLTNIKAKVISQSIKCESGCSVSEKAVFTKSLWG